MIKQTSWFERRFEYNFPVGYFPVILERLRGAPLHLSTMIKESGEEGICETVTNSWSAKEHIGHLYDVEDLWYGRVEDIMAGKKVMREADLTNRKTNEAGHNQKKVDELLRQFRNERNKLIEKVKDIDERTAVLSALHPRLQTPMRLIDFLYFVAEHDGHHLATIRQLIINPR